MLANKAAKQTLSTQSLLRISKGARYSKAMSLVLARHNAISVKRLCKPPDRPTIPLMQIFSPAIVGSSNGFSPALLS
jgi:hypothetical protein